MGMCEYYEERCIANCPPTFTHVCMGAKYAPEVDCGGDESKCSEYPEKRVKTYTTAEMWIEAHKNPKKHFFNTEEFINSKNYLAYNESIGFYWKKGQQSSNLYTNVLEFMSATWQEYTPTPTMTKAEVLEKYGVKVID